MSRSTDSSDTADSKKKRIEVDVPPSIGSSFSQDHTKGATELPPAAVRVSEELIDGKSQKEVAEDLDVSRDTVRRFVDNMKQAGVIEVVDKGSWANYVPKGALGEELNSLSRDPEEIRQSDGLESKFSFSDYPNGVGGEIVRSIDRANSKKRSAERLNRNLNAEREEIEAAMYKLHEVDILRTWKTEEWIFGELNEEFEDEFNFEPDELTGEHMGVLLDTILGYSLSEIEERRNIDRALDFRRDLDYLLEEAKSDGPAVEYQLTPEGECVAGLVYAHLDAGNSYSDLFESETEAPDSKYSEQEKSDLKWTDFS